MRGVLTLTFLPAGTPLTDVEAIEALAESFTKPMRRGRCLTQLLPPTSSARMARASRPSSPPVLLGRGFQFEKTGLFNDVEVPGLRPDLFHSALGIIGEFERGGTLTNNRDLLDFYKVHVCAEARHLFLFVRRTSSTGEARASSAPRGCAPSFAARRASIRWPSSATDRCFDSRRSSTAPVTCVGWAVPDNAFEEQPTQHDAATRALTRRLGDRSGPAHRVVKCNGGD
jgi:hypothetical protein